MIVVGIILAAIGLLLIIAFICNRLKCRIKVEASVKKLAEQSVTLRGSTVKQYIPVFIYMVDGVTYTASANTATTKKDKFTVGQKLTIHANPKNPSSIRYGSNLGFLLAGLVFAGLGALFIVLSII